ncbi:MAG: phosphonoacetaldehyde dehydrogenase [Planctomyces sp.]|nr:phosphonoacetaldehyde dehydrogenase [Planctomyces sp.]
MPFNPVFLPLYIAGEPLVTSQPLEVRYPFDGSLTGTVSSARHEHLESAIVAGLKGGPTLSRYEREQILRRASLLFSQRTDELARLMTRETGLALRDTRAEATRVCDVLHFAALAAIESDDPTFWGDVTPPSKSLSGKNRSLHVLREPLRLAAAITPFNHPLTQLAHKVAPAIAAGTPLILKPSDKTPLTAVRFAETLYEAGLPGWMLSVLVGPVEAIIEPLISDPRIEALSFTGSVSIGKRIAATAGYKRLCLELGGNSELIVLRDADLALATKIACEGSYRNSGQRCTAVKRVLAEDSIYEELTRRIVEATANYTCGDPEDSKTEVGTLISEPAAIGIEKGIHDAISRGAELLAGGKRDVARLSPTVLRNVPRDVPLVVEETFGPVTPVIPVRDLGDAIAFANSGRYGLSTSVATDSMSQSMRAIRELRTGMVHINEVPGYRLEHAPFGGIKDSGLGIKEGIIEAKKFFSNSKTYSLPW